MSIVLKNNPHSKCVITSGFGVRKLNGNTKMHQGIDIAPTRYASQGDKIYAVDKGRIEISKIDSKGINAGYGNYIIINHGTYKSLYAHLMALEKKAGQSVNAGEKIGNMGNTGDITGVHLHFAIQVNGDFIDPVPYLKSIQRPTLKIGASSTDSVKMLQMLLNDVTNAQLVIDGKFGAKTELEVKKYQSKNGIVGDGVVGPETWEKL